MYSIFEQLLQENHLTPNKFSKLCGIPQASLSDWKNGKSVPKIDKMIGGYSYYNGFGSLVTNL